MVRQQQLGAGEALKNKQRGKLIPGWGDMGREEEEVERNQIREGQDDWKPKSSEAGGGKGRAGAVGSQQVSEQRAQD